MFGWLVCLMLFSEWLRVRYGDMFMISVVGEGKWVMVFDLDVVK